VLTVPVIRAKLAPLSFKNSTFPLETPPITVSAKNRQRCAGLLEKSSIKASASAEDESAAMTIRAASIEAVLFIMISFSHGGISQQLTCAALLQNRLASILLALPPSHRISHEGP
jgi:hypothetical protein